DGAQHRLALYALDWDVNQGGRSERIDILDAGTGQVLDTRNVTNFSAGVYLTWNLKGHGRILVTNTGTSGNTCGVSGLFCAPSRNNSSTGSASFVGTDTTTQGSWQGPYGAQGYNVIGDAVNYPAYAQIGISGATAYVWAGSTTDVRALQKATNPNDRVAAAD